MRSAALNPDEPQAETRTLAQITKYFSVSISLPGPTNAGHQLPSGSESVVRAWQAAIRRNEGLGHPVQSSSIGSGRIQPQDFPTYHLYLYNNGKRYSLSFDCANCEMVVRLPAFSEHKACKPTDQET